MSHQELNARLDSYRDPLFSLSSVTAVCHMALRARNHRWYLCAAMGVACLFYLACYRYVSSQSSVASTQVSSWCNLNLLTICVVSVITAAIAGSSAAPGTQEWDAIQATLITRITPFAFTLGRLLAAATAPMAMLAASFVCAMCLPRAGLFVSVNDSIYPRIISMYLCMSVYVVCIASIAQTCAIYKQTGSNKLFGAIAATVAAVISVTGIALVNPVLERVQNPSPLINALLAVNPLAVIVSIFHVDILREDWVYNRLQAHDYPFTYPPATSFCFVYFAIAVLCLVIASRQLRKATR